MPVHFEAYTPFAPPASSLDERDSKGALTLTDEAPFDLWEQNIDQGYAPIDPLTGIPLPIAPTEPPTSVSSSAWHCDNHHVYFWNKHPDLHDFAGRVVRHSRIIRGGRWAHEWYHYAFPNGLAWVPGSIHEKFYCSVMATSGIMPEYAVDVRWDKPVIVKLGWKAMKHLQSSDNVFAEVEINRLTGNDDYLKRRGIFFMQYALENGFDGVDIALLERLIEERDESMRRHLGMMVISSFIDTAVSPIAPNYIKMAERGLLPADKPRTPKRLLNDVTAAKRLDYLATVENRARLTLAA